jgi:hypothetical protein
MPIPKINSGEKKDDYMGRCMSKLVGEGKPQEQAYAICKTEWENKFYNHYIEKMKKLLKKKKC